MTPKKASTTTVKAKKKVVIEEEEMVPEIHFSEMQYPEGVIIGQEWDSPIRKRKVSEYNHRTLENKKELDSLLISRTNKCTMDDMPVYDNAGEKLLKRIGVYQLYELPYFGKYEPLYQWLMSRVHEDFFYFAARKVRISYVLVSLVTSLKATGEDIKGDLADKATIVKTKHELGYLKGPRGMDIDKLKNCPVVQSATHLVTKLNDQEQWSQVNTMWLHVAHKMLEGTIYNIVSYIAEQIVKEVRIGGKIIFGDVLLSLVFMEIGVPDGPKEKVWEYPIENKSPVERFSKYLCKGAMMDDVKQRAEKWYDRLRMTFGEEWCIPKDLPTVVGK